MCTLGGENKSVVFTRGHAWLRFALSTPEVLPSLCYVVYCKEKIILSPSQPHRMMDTPEFKIDWTHLAEKF